MANPLAGIYNSINDKCWDLLDWLYDKGIPLAEYFEKYNIPPILFPLAIILVIALIIWLLLPAGAPVAGCGDGICGTTETCGTCAQDCGNCTTTPPTGEAFMLIVTVTGPALNGDVTVSLYDENQRYITDQSGRKAQFKFYNIYPQKISATATCPSGKRESSTLQQVDKDKNQIFLNLPMDCFDTVRNVECGDGRCDYNLGETQANCYADCGPEISEDTPPPPPIEQYGAIDITVVDAITGEPIDIVLVSALRSSDDILEDQKTLTNGHATFNIRSGKEVYLNAIADGYLPFLGMDNTSVRVYVSPEGMEFITIRMMPSDAPLGAQGTLEVCVTRGDEPVLTGTVSVFDVTSGNQMLRQSDLGTGIEGCLRFTVDVNKAVKAAVTSPPQGCTPSGFSDTVTITEDVSRISLNLTCQEEVEMAAVRVLVRDRFNRLLTQN
ncbi:MAG: hypothetical protein JXB14_04110, partial [Candidatus Altiarchaeota archaeon]|nr:hypothetical protein [Candidatus Altiarchaeota archaeon]